MLDEHAFGLGHGQKEGVKAFLVIFAKRTQLALGRVLELDFFRIFL
jgi:hypothetical protein